METVAPTAHAECIHIIIPIIAIYDLETRSIDIVVAFLSADINAEVWVT